MPDLEKINRVIKEYFQAHEGVDKISAKDLMPKFIKAGIFKADHRNGLPIRELLRTLDEKNQLFLIPTVYPDRKAVNTNWYFVNNSMSKNPESVNKGTLKVTKEKESKEKQIKQKKYSRADSDEYYVIDLCDKILDFKGKRQHRFEFLLGDKNEKGNQAKLPVDVYYPELKCVIEYRENQHTTEKKIFDKPDVLTVSGVHRGEQRKIYDQRRRDVLPEHGITLIEIPYHTFNCDSVDRIIRNTEKDKQALKKLLYQYFPDLIKDFKGKPKSSGND